VMPPSRVNFFMPGILSRHARHPCPDVTDVRRIMTYCS
jgi:hypothetical protein